MQKEILNTNGSWKGWQQRLSFVQMFLGVAMQTSYVAFPSYNFAIAIWSAYCATTATMCSQRTWAVLLTILPLSILMDIIWISLWTSGEIFQDRLCNANRVSILTCGGTDHFPGCRTNRFAFAMLLFNMLAKTASIICIAKVMQRDNNKTAEVHDYPSYQQEQPSAPEQHW